MAPGGAASRRVVVLLLALSVAHLAAGRKPWQAGNQRAAAAPIYSTGADSGGDNSTNSTQGNSTSSGTPPGAGPITTRAGLSAAYCFPDTGFSASNASRLLCMKGGLLTSIRGVQHCARIVCGAAQQREGAQGTVHPQTYPLTPGAVFCRTVLNPPVIACPPACVGATQNNTVGLPLNTTCICPAALEQCPSFLGRCHCPDGGFSLCMPDEASVGCQAACDASFGFWYSTWWQQYTCPLEAVTQETGSSDGNQVVDVQLVTQAPAPAGNLPLYPQWSWNLRAQGPQDGRRRLLQRAWRRLLLRRRPAP